jgi:type II secretion system protein I
VADRNATLRGATAPRGFTLLEVLISLAILATTLLLAYQVISGAIAAEERSERWTVASYLAEAMVLDSLTPFPSTEETDGAFAAPMDAYHWHRSVRPAAHSDAREVEVVVTWTSDKREERVSLTGLAVK